MGQRRKKSIMHGSAEDTRVFHHEHRSTRGRKPLYKIKETYKFRSINEQSQEYYEKKYANEIMRRFNSDKHYRKIYKNIK